MTLKEARVLGQECGLETDAECINNIIVHAGMLFVWDCAGKEIDELITDAKANGVKFSRVCGDAILDGDSENEPCYICKKLVKDNTMGENSRRIVKKWNAKKAEWEFCKFTDVQKGDFFKLYESTWEPVIDMYGHDIFQATDDGFQDSDGNRGIWAEGIKSIEITKDSV